MRHWQGIEASAVVSNRLRRQRNGSLVEQIAKLCKPSDKTNTSTMINIGLFETTPASPDRMTTNTAVVTPCCTYKTNFQQQRITEDNLADKTGLDRMISGTDGYMLGRAALALRRSLSFPVAKLEKTNPQKVRRKECVQRPAVDRIQALACLLSTMTALQAVADREARMQHTWIGPTSITCNTMFLRISSWLQLPCLPEVVCFTSSYRKASHRE